MDTWARARLEACVAECPAITTSHHSMQLRVDAKEQVELECTQASPGAEARLPVGRGKRVYAPQEGAKRACM